MVKNQKHDRYAGIASIPDPLDSRRPRPFRIDEDGTVIYRDEEVGIGAPMVARKARELARAGILDWSQLNQTHGGRSPLSPREILATGARGQVNARVDGKGVIPSRRTIDGIDYEVISANSYDPALSNGKTAIPNGEMIAAAKAGNAYTAVTDAGPERGAYIIRAPLDFSGSQAGRCAGQ